MAMDWKNKILFREGSMPLIIRIGDDNQRLVWFTPKVIQLSIVQLY